MTFGEKIRFLRMKKGLSQNQLATLCNMERRTIWGYEHGQNICTDIRNFRTLANALGCSIFYLILSNEDEKDYSDYLTIEESFLELLKRLDYNDAVGMVAEVLTLYHDWIDEQKNPHSEDISTQTSEEEKSIE